MDKKINTLNEESLSIDKTPQKSENTFNLEANLENIKIISQLILDYQKSQRQLIWYAIISAGLVVTLILGLADKSNLEIIAIIFLLLPILYWGIAIAYFACSKHIIIAGKYWNQLGNELDKAILSKSTQKDNLTYNWEKYLRSGWNEDRKSGLIMSLWPIGEIVLIAFLAIGSLIVFLYMNSSLKLPCEIYHIILVIVDLLLILSAIVIGISVGKEGISHRSTGM